MLASVCSNHAQRSGIQLVLCRLVLSVQGTEGAAENNRCSCLLALSNGDSQAKTEELGT